MVRVVSTALAIAGIGTVSPVVAQTAGETSDLVARWDANAVGTDFGTYSAYGKLEILIDSNVVRGAVLRYDDGSRTMIDSGRLTLFPGCPVSGRLSEEDDGTIYRVDIPGATFS